MFKYFYKKNKFIKYNMNYYLYFIMIVNLAILCIFKNFENKNIRLILFSLLLFYSAYKYEIKNGFIISLLIAIAEYIVELIVLNIPILSNKLWYYHNSQVDYLNIYNISIRLLPIWIIPLWSIVIITFIKIYNIYIM